MAHIFLSYARSDAAKAQSLAAALQDAGHSVWWDRHIEGGSQYAKVIEKALADAEVIVVLWSAESVDSHWVRDEAAAGRDTGRLVPAILDGTNPPLGFRQFQALDLSQWGGRGKSAQLDALLTSIASVASGDGAAALAIKGPGRPARGFAEELLARPWRLIALAIGLLVFALGLAISRPWEESRNDPPAPATVHKPPQQ